jgi:diguanylate cyclase (GGDEF)-like protein
LSRADDPVRFTLATIDIDDFKAINDRFGHPVGDEALVRVADALRASIREQDAVFRVGGEEFAVLLPGLSAADALPLAERLRSAVASISFGCPLRVSVGLAAWPTDAPDGKILIELADAALYAAKHAGKDCSRVTASYAA